MALLAAGRLDADAVVAICPAGADLLLRGLRARRFEFRFDEGPLEGFLLEHDLVAAVEDLRTPMLLLHAEGDEQVPVEGSVALHRAARMERKRLIALPGGHHRSIQHDAELQGESLRFVEKGVLRLTQQVAGGLRRVVDSAADGVAGLAYRAAGRPAHRAADAAGRLADVLPSALPVCCTVSAAPFWTGLVSDPGSDGRAPPPPWPLPTVPGPPGPVDTSVRREGARCRRAAPRRRCRGSPRRAEGRPGRGARHGRGRGAGADGGDLRAPLVPRHRRRRPSRTGCRCDR